MCDAHFPRQARLSTSGYIWLTSISLTAPIDGDPGKQRKDWDRSHLRRPSGNR